MDFAQINNFISECGLYKFPAYRDNISNYICVDFCQFYDSVLKSVKERVYIMEKKKLSPPGE